MAKLSGEGFTAGEVYRVAVTEQDGGVVPAGQFLGVGPAELHCNLNSSVLREDASARAAWTVTWSATNGTSGTLPDLIRTTTFPLQVRSAEAVTD